MFCRGTYGISVFNPSLETRNGENILCFDEFMLKVVKTFNVLEGAGMGPPLPTPLEARSGENTECLAGVRYESGQNTECFGADGYAPTVSNTPLEARIGENTECLAGVP